MILKDLQMHIYENVSIYTKSKEGDWDKIEDLYKGPFESIPDELLNRKVHVIGARRKGILDISIEN